MSVKAVVSAFVIALFVFTAHVFPEDEDKIKINYTGTNTFLWRLFDTDFLQNNSDSGENKWEIYNRLVMNLSMKNFTFGFQADFDEYEVSKGDNRLEKRYLKYDGKNITLTAGDFYSSFGRGNALSIVKTHESFGLENQFDDTIDGGYVNVKNNKYVIKALTGKVFDKRTQLEDTVSGINPVVKPFSWLRLGASAVKTELELESGDEVIAGSQVEMSLLDGNLIIAHEYTSLDSDFRYTNGADEGRASYLEISGQLKNVSLALEYKDLQSFFAKYSTPPILEEQQQDLLADFFAIYPEDLEGTKFRVDYMLPNGTNLFGIASYFREKATRHPSYFRYNREITHYYGGVEHSFLNGMYIYATYGVRDEEGSGYYYQFTGETTHGAIQIDIPLHDNFSTHLEYAFMDFHGDVLEFQRNKFSAGFSIPQYVTATWNWERSNLPGELFFSGQEHFYYAQIDVKILRRHLARLFIGDNRGGIKCSGGVCKYIPAFSGLRVEGVIRF